MKRALITGITGQDGSYLTELLLEKGYVVHGIKRRSSSFNTQRIDHIYQDPHVDNARFKLHYGDLSDTSNLVRIIQETQPDEIYNLGAQSHVAVSFESQSTQQMWMAWVRCEFWKRYAFWAWRKRHVFIKPVLQSCMAWCKRHLRKKLPRFIREALMPWPSCMPIGSW